MKFRYFRKRFEWCSFRPRFEIQQYGLHGVLGPFFVVLFVSGGIFPNLERRRVFENFYSAAVTALSAATIFGYVIGFLNSKTILTALLGTVQGAALILYLHMHWTIRNYGNSLSNFTEAYLRQPPSYVGHDASRYVEKLFKNLLRKLWIAYLITYFPICFAVLVFSIFVDVDFEDENFHYMPFWYACSADRNDSGEFPCWRSETYSTYFIKDTVAAFMWNSQQFASVSALLFFLFVQCFAQSHVEILGLKVAEVSDKIKKIGSVEGNGEKVQLLTQLRTEIVNIIKYYQFIRR